MRIPSSPWLKIVDVCVPAPGEAIITGSGKVCVPGSIHCASVVCPVVAPDNAYGALDLNAHADTVAERLKRDGFEVDGASAVEAFGEIRIGEWYLGRTGRDVVKCDSQFEFMGAGDPRRIRLRKIQPKTKTWAIAETCDPKTIELWKSQNGMSGVTVRFEERPV